VVQQDIVMFNEACIIILCLHPNSEGHWKKHNKRDCVPNHPYIGSFLTDEIIRFAAIARVSA